MVIINIDRFKGEVMGPEMNIWLILWQSGLVVKLVLLLLIFASILSWAIIVQKNKYLKRIEISNKQFDSMFKSQTSLTSIMDRISDYNDSSLSILFQKGYFELSKIKEKFSQNESLDKFPSYLKENGIHAMERSLKQGVNIANEELEKRLSMLATIGSISPFIGLFGTVWGIIDSFAGLASGGGSIEAVAPGIAEALVATAVGLFAAIPAVWAFNIFNNRVSKINTDMENFGQEFLNTVERNILIKK